MQERYSEEVKSILEAAQQQAVMNYQQELSCAHILVALSSSEGFFTDFYSLMSRQMKETLHRRLKR